MKARERGRVLNLAKGSRAAPGGCLRDGTCAGNPRLGEVVVARQAVESGFVERSRKNNFDSLVGYVFCVSCIRAYDSRHRRKAKHPSQDLLEVDALAAKQCSALRAEDFVGIPYTVWTFFFSSSVFVWAALFCFLCCGSEKVFDVMQNGMDSLGADERNAYVSDFKGFVTYVRDKGFQVYADKVSTGGIRLYLPRVCGFITRGSPGSLPSPLEFVSHVRRYSLNELFSILR